MHLNGVGGPGAFTQPSGFAHNLRIIALEWCNEPSRSILLEGEDNVISRHLPIALVELDPLFEIECPHQTVIGLTPRLGQLR